jgi:hypothetical protein
MTPPSILIARSFKIVGVTVRVVAPPAAWQFLRYLFGKGDSKSGDALLSILTSKVLRIVLEKGHGNSCGPLASEP